ncbi:NADH dehydrogenase subunit 4L (mitochondrion) [Paramicrosporidium saccamoebae]|uniref:NADH-ubiquinone oxidoreductase chain 4L n=1 Tax=Paramicrosporidium saccamoebae TaxID=1246581 RepID=A0A2H9TR75_9FUNG|nr:NADH dehydrogenase subunit 4L [Paramicrosporidium saccamoebae]
MKLISNILIIVSIISIIKNYKNNILILLSLELLFIALSLIFLESGLYLDDFEGIISSIFIICLTATESALGLTILILASKNTVMTK